MSVLTVFLASLAAFEHFYIFYLESLATPRHRLVVSLIWIRKNCIVHL